MQNSVITGGQTIRQIIILFNVIGLFLSSGVSAVQPAVGAEIPLYLVKDGKAQAVIVQEISTNKSAWQIQTAVNDLRKCVK